MLFQKQAVALASASAERGAAGWALALLPLHVKLYSPCYMLFDRFAAPSSLSVEPLNAFYYVAILCLVFELGREAFGRATGVLAACLVGLWPSLLFHTTLPLHDPLFITVALLFMLINLRWLTRDYSLARAAAVAASGALVGFVLWVTRSDMWELWIAIVFVTCCAVAARILKGRRALRWNLAGAALLLAFCACVPFAAKPFYGPVGRLARSHGVASFDVGEPPPPVDPSAEPTATESPPSSYLAARISYIRHRFVVIYPDAGSNIDTGVEFRSAADILAYVPRAALIGLFAPFPRMWFERGTPTGRLGRAAAGAESLALYFVDLSALVCLWRRRREPAAWWLFAVAILGATALGLVVTNVGALYRLRYAFAIPLVILGGEGVRQTLNCASPERRRAGLKDVD